MHLGARELVPFVVVAVLYGMQLLFSSRTGSEDSIEAALDEVPRALGWFVGLEYVRLIHNRTFVIFITKGALCGALVRGTLKGGRRRELILLGDQDGPALVARLREGGFGGAA